MSTILESYPILVVTLITYCHGIGLGWLSPMLPLLQTEGKSPLDFVIDVHEASWLGAVISMGAITGNFTYSYIMNRFGRKVALYCLAVPNVVSCEWFVHPMFDTVIE